MEEDILTLMEALTTQAIDTDPDPAAAASVGVGPPMQTLPLEEALSTACHGVNAEEKTAHQKKTEETREMFAVCPCLSTAVPGRCADVAPEVPSHTDGGGNRRKKSSRKRRNRKKSKKVYLSWPMTLETRASSTSPFPRQASAMGALSCKEQRRKGKKEKTVVSAQFWQEPAGTVLPEASTGQPSLEGTSVAVRKGRRAQKRHRCKKRAKKNQKIESSPWPVTVQAWASFVRPDLMQTSFTESLLAANNGIEDDESVFTLYKSPQVDLLDSPAPLLQASWEEVAPDVNPKRKKQRWQGRKDNALDPTWPLEIQAWVPFPAAAAAEDPVQTLSEDLCLQWECSPPLERENESNCFIPWSAGAEEGPFSAIAPLQFSLKEAPALRIGQSQTDEAKRNPDTLQEQLQGSEELALESYQSWGKAEKYQGAQHGDDWEYSILDLSTQADCYYGDPFSEEGGQAPTLVGSYAYTSISEPETGKWEAEEDKATFQTLWMGKWGGL